MKNKPLIIIAGPTGTGKSELAIELAKQINGAVISADSMQVYKNMNIGTAKITSEQMQGIEHYMIDIMDPTDDFNIVMFKTLAKKYVEELYERDIIPIICGGTGFYIQSLLYDIDFDESEDLPQYREDLYSYANEYGADALHEKLKDIDFESYKSIHPNNIVRVVRALEYYRQTGQKISEHNENQKHNKSPYDFAFFVLCDDRDYMYNRIDLRVDKMIEDGLVDEVLKLKKLGLGMNNISMHGLGYKEVLSYLDDEISLDEAIRIIKRDSRHYAKKQLTWFKRDNSAIFIDKRNFNRDLKCICNELIRICKDKGIIENESNV